MFCGRRYTLATFSDDELQFRSKRSTLDVSIFILRGKSAGAALQTCRVARFLQITLSGLREVMTSSKFNGGRGMLSDEM